MESSEPTTATSILLIAALTALLTEFVLLNVFKEVPTNRSSSFACF